ncbi:MAG TPA: hypothetical protein VND40_02755 [Nitrososphaerales archaeon]|nr:hypothetical protein [Nitrososphaerales archaeon]
MKAARPAGPAGRRRRAGLSSVYGFIMIYLLVIASLQAVSVALSSSQRADAAAQQAGQVAQMRSLERLQVAMSRGGNVTITNDGLIPSRLSFLLLQNSTVSRELPVQDSLAVGASVVVVAGSTGSFPSVAVVTSLGNVFASSPSSASPSGAGLKTLAAAVGGAGVDAQLYQNPSDPTRFFLAEGSSTLAFSALTGEQLWSFDAGQGEVTDVLPLSDGTAYVSDGYYGDQFSSNLFMLTPSGTSASTYSMRLLRLYTTIEVQFPNNGQPPYPVGSQPVQKAADSLFAYYDGWFFSSSGPSPTTVPADTYNLAASDAGQFYVFTASANPGGFGCTAPRGNEVTVYAYSAGAQGVADRWSTPVFFGICNLYPNDLIASSAGSGLVASIFSETYWSQPNYYGGPYEGSNPFLAVLSSSSGALLRSGDLDSTGYTSLATDGTHVYLSIPSSDEVEVLSATGSGAGTFYHVGIPASTLVWADGSLFAISASQVKVYDSSMALKKAIDFSPLALYSLSNSKSLEAQMVQPSFLVLNSTSYLALLRNSTGFGSLVVGAYSP